MEDEAGQVRQGAHRNRRRRWWGAAVFLLAGVALVLWAGFGGIPREYYYGVDFCTYCGVKRTVDRQWIGPVRTRNRITLKETA